jgi:hypothetical protein
VIVSCFEGDDEELVGELDDGFDDGFDEIDGELVDELDDVFVDVESLPHAASIVTTRRVTVERFMRGLRRGSRE